MDDLGHRIEFVLEHAQRLGSRAMDLAVCPCESCGTATLPFERFVRNQSGTLSVELVCPVCDEPRSIVHPWYVED